MGRKNFVALASAVGLVLTPIAAPVYAQQSATSQTSSAKATTRASAPARNESQLKGKSGIITVVIGGIVAIISIVAIAGGKKTPTSP